MTYKVLELLFSDLQMAQNLEKALQGLADEGFVIQSINTTFSSVLVVANKAPGYQAEKQRIVDEHPF